MKKMMMTLIAMLTIVASASAMSYEQARNEALFLTDKMAYELNLNDAQYEAAYEINLDYLMGVTSQYDVMGAYWERRNADLRFILHTWQWEAFCAATYFYRPLYWNAGYWHFAIYARYPHRDYFYFGRPHFYASYRGGHSWRMNGGRSFYEHRTSIYRPAGVSRTSHFGMRDGWNRGDYRSGRGNSSTRVTVGHQPQPGNGSSHSSHGSFGSGRSNHGQGNTGVGSGRSNHGQGNTGVGSGNSHHGQGNTGVGSGNSGRSGNSGSGVNRPNNGSRGGSSSSGAFGNTRSSQPRITGSASSHSHVSGSFSTPRSSTPSTRSAGTMSSGSRSNGGALSGGGRSSAGSMRSGSHSHSSSGGSHNSNGHFGGARR